MSRGIHSFHCWGSLPIMQGSRQKIAITPDDKTIYCLNCDFKEKSLKILKINLQTLMSQKFLISMILDLKKPRI